MIMGFIQRLFDRPFDVVHGRSSALVDECFLDAQELSRQGVPLGAGEVMMRNEQAMVLGARFAASGTNVDDRDVVIVPDVDALMAT